MRDERAFTLPAWNEGLPRGEISKLVEVACGYEREVSFCDPRKELPAVRELPTVDDVLKTVPFAPEPARRTPEGPIPGRVWVSRDDRGSMCSCFEDRGHDAALDRDELMQPERESMCRVVGDVPIVSQLEPGEDEEPVLGQGARRLELQLSEIAGPAPGVDRPVQRIIQPSGVICDAKNIESRCSVEIDELRDRKDAVTPRRVGMQLTQQELRSHLRQCCPYGSAVGG